MHDDGGPAFPCETPDRTEMFTSGMSLRDWFAGQALAGWGEAHHGATSDLGSGFPYPKSNAPHYAQRMADFAYEVADAMLAARKAAP